MPLITQNLCFSYPGQAPALQGIDAVFEEGFFYCVVGPNGAGKSTFLKLLLGLEKPSQGQILLDEKDWTQRSIAQRALEMAYVPQNFQMEFDFTVEQVVGMGRVPYQDRFALPSLADQSAIEQALAHTGLLGLRDRSASALSGGEQQRVAIARALCQDTAYLLLDEPISHLDIRHQSNILRLLRSLTPKKTIIAIMHDLNLAGLFSDRMLLINQGQTAFSGTPSEVLTYDKIETVYDCKVVVVQDPIYNSPHVLLIRDPL